MLQNLFYKLLKVALFILCIAFLTTNLFAQSVGINSDGTNPDPSAMLDIKSATKGLLIPNIALTGTNDSTTITSPATSLLVYNTATAGITPNTVSPGYYFNAGSTSSPVWMRLSNDIADGSETKVSAGTNITVSGAGTTASPYVMNVTAADGSETKVTAGTNVTMTGTGTAGNPYVMNATAANGSETKVTAGSNITLTGSGTTASPYVINAPAINYGDIKQGIQTADHNGWVKLNGRLKSSLTASQQTQATTLGIGTNLPNADNSYLVQNGTTLASVSGSNTKTIARNQLPNVVWTGNLNYVAHGAYVSATATGVFSQSSTGSPGNATGGGSTNYFSLTIPLNGNVTQQTLNIQPQSLSVNMFIYLGQ